MKRFLSLVLLLAFALSFPAFADDVPALTSAGMVSEDGQTVTLVINISGSSAVCSCSLDLIYDPTLLVCESVTAGSAVTGTLFVANENYDTDTIRVAWMSAVGLPADGEVVTITFSTLPNTQEQTSQLSLANTSAFDMSSSSITITASGTSVTLPATAQPDVPPIETPDDSDNDDPSAEPGNGPVVDAPVLPTPPTAEADDPEVFLMAFNDVFATDYYYDAVCWAVEQGITTGTAADKFSPTAPCTRAQTVTLLWRAAGCPQPSYSSGRFTDVTPDAYYYDAVCWAVEQGITTGTSATTFSPEAVVNRAQVVTFLWRYAGWDSLATGITFVDVPASAYFEHAVHWAVANSITNGTSQTTFSPNMDCSRGQIVTFLYRYFILR